MKDVMICVDQAHDPDCTDGAPVFEGDHAAPIWALYEVLGHDAGADRWAVKFHAAGLTYQQADDLATELGLVGRRIS